MLADPIPLSFSMFFVQHISETIFKQHCDGAALLPQPLPSLFGLIPIPGIAGPMLPKAYPDFYRPDGTTIPTRLIYRAYERLLKEYRFPTWHNLIVAWSAKVPLFVPPQRKRGKTHDYLGMTLDCSNVRQDGDRHEKICQGHNKNFNNS